MSQVFIAGRTTYNGLPVPNADIAVSNALIGRSDASGNFMVGVESSDSARDWAIQGNSNGQLVRAKGTSVINTSVNVGDVALSVINGPAWEFWRDEALTYAK